MSNHECDADVSRIRVTCPRCAVCIQVSERRFKRTDGPGYITLARCVFCGFVFTAAATNGDEKCDT